MYMQGVRGGDQGPLSSLGQIDESGITQSNGVRSEAAASLTGASTSVIMPIMPIFARGMSCFSQHERTCRILLPDSADRPGVGRVEPASSSPVGPKLDHQESHLSDTEARKNVKIRKEPGGSRPAASLLYCT